MTAGPEPKKENKKSITVNGILIKMTLEQANDLLIFCDEPRTRTEIREHCGINSADYFRVNILKPLIEAKLLKLTIPEKPSSPNQRYQRA